MIAHAIIRPRVASMAVVNQIGQYGFASDVVVEDEDQEGGVDRLADLGRRRTSASGSPGSARRISGSGSCRRACTPSRRPASSATRRSPRSR